MLRRLVVSEAPFVVVVSVRQGWSLLIAFVYCYCSSVAEALALVSLIFVLASRVRETLQAKALLRLPALARRVE